MKYLLSVNLLIFLFLVHPLGAQNKNKKDEASMFYLLKNDWSVANNFDSAAYFMQLIKDNDTTYICRFYNKFGPMVKQEAYKDEALTIPNGLFLWYNKEGYLDSSGQVTNGFRNGYWYFYRNDKLYKSLCYKKQRVFEKIDYETDTYIDSAGKQQSIKEMKLRDSVYRDSLMRARDSTKPNQVIAKFTGWNNYISQNLKTPDRLINVLGQGQHDVIVSFLVDKNGNVTEVMLFKSVEWSGDDEVFKLFKNAPKWTPAQQNGRPVIYRQKQKLSFVVQ